MNPPPGIYYGVPAETYHAWSYASRSRLLPLRQSPAHALWNLRYPRKETDSMELGTLLHMLMLEPPEVFASKTVRIESLDKRTKEGKDVAAKYPDEYIVTDAKWRKLDIMRSKLLAHPLAKTLLESPGRNEVSIVFDDPATGVRCKARADSMRAAGLFDLKTTRCAEPSAFRRDAAKYGYYLEAAMHLRAFEVCYGRSAPFFCVCVETEPPHEVAVYHMPTERATRELDTHLRTWKRCTDSGEWPGYRTGVVTLHVPDYYEYLYQQDGSEERID